MSSWWTKATQDLDLIDWVFIVMMLAIVVSLFTQDEPILTCSIELGTHASIDSMEVRND